MIFARGALAAARFLVDQPAGLYSMQDVIGAL
jgi:4-hydroxy-tetrahydrodipicolinate reductase